MYGPHSADLSEILSYFFGGVGELSFLVFISMFRFDDHTQRAGSRWESCRSLSGGAWESGGADLRAHGLPGFESLRSGDSAVKRAACRSCCVLAGVPEQK